mmetsp:Transcript_108796/g.313474  ORF Transcript_108796/g.313474 Transcript_108796/m.313474 type:complete len:306 (+) Transcript_108796:94-1011(+)
MGPGLLSVVGAAVALLALLAPTKAEVKVHVYGQSGKFKMYDSALGTQGSAPGPTVTMDELVERDAGGAAVCNSGPMAQKHSVNSFATQDFTVHDVEPDIAIGEARANRVKFNTDIGNAIGNLQVDTYVISQGGKVGNGEEEWSFAAADMKWNVVFNSWNFCTDGAYLDLKVTVSGLEGAEKAADGSKVTFGNTSLVLARKVELDGVLQEMPEGFPSIDIQGGAVGIVFRFPRFESNATYDPGFMNDDVAAEDGPDAVEGDGAGANTTTEAHLGTNNTAMLDAAVWPQASMWPAVCGILALGRAWA